MKKKFSKLILTSGIFVILAVVGIILSMGVIRTYTSDTSSLPELDISDDKATVSEECMAIRQEYSNLRNELRRH